MDYKFVSQKINNIKNDIDALASYLGKNEASYDVYKYTHELGDKFARDIKIITRFEKFNASELFTLIFVYCAALINGDCSEFLKVIEKENQYAH